MIGFITLTGAESKVRACIDVDAIDAVLEADRVTSNRTVVVLSCGQVVTVRETYDEVLHLIEIAKEETS